MFGPSVSSGLSLCACFRLVYSFNVLAALGLRGFAQGGLAVAHGAPFMAVHGRLITLASRGVGLGSRALRVTGCGTWA